MIIRRDIEQASAAWLQARSGIPTASEFGNLLTPKFELRTGEMPKSYLAEKVAEKLMGGPLIGFGSWCAEQGNLLESEAVPWLALDRNCDIERVGLCQTDDGRIACSPDGIIDGKIGVEFKSPQPENQVKYLLGGVVPEKFLPQIHGGMFVTGFQSWLFCSYHRKLPKLVIEVQRDEEIQSKIKLALNEFLARFDEALLRLRGK